MESCISVVNCQGEWENREMWMVASGKEDRQLVEKTKNQKKNVWSWYGTADQVRGGGLHHAVDRLEQATWVPKNAFVLWK
jgi:hypothetical protein